MPDGCMPVFCTCPWIEYPLMIFPRGLDARRCFMVEYLPLDRFMSLFDYSNNLRFHKHKVKGFEHKQENSEGFVLYVLFIFQHFYIIIQYILQYQKQYIHK